MSYMESTDALTIYGSTGMVFNPWCWWFYKQYFWIN